MHQSSMDLMEQFAEAYLNRGKETVLDIGAMDTDNQNYNYRNIFTFRGHSYVGTDLEAGANVDMIMERYKIPFPSDSFSIVISGQTMEHVEDLHRFVIEASRVLKINGLMCLIAPAEFVYHAFPIDCWRFLPDGMAFLMRDIAKLRISEVRKIGCDCIGIAQKMRDREDYGQI